MLRIKDWSTHYENNRTREMKSMSWLPLPVKLDGSGYSELIDHKDGAAHFGVWCALLQLAAGCEVRGTLTRGDGLPHDDRTIARQLRMKPAVVAAAISRLLSREVGWLEAADCGEPAGNPQVSRTLPAVSPHPSAEKVRSRRGEERRVEDREPAPAAQAAPMPQPLIGPFDEFREWYPGPIEGNAWRIFGEIANTPERIEALLTNGPLWAKHKRYVDGFHGAIAFLKSEVWLAAPPPTRAEPEGEFAKMLRGDYDKPKSKAAGGVA